MMTIDVDDVLSDTDLDDFLGGAVNSGVNLRPRSWDDCLPARQYAIDELLRIFGRNRPALGEDDIDDVVDLKHAIELGASARLYFLKMQQAPEPGVFYHLEKRYREQFEAEVQRLIDDIIEDSDEVDPVGRGPMSIELQRR